MKTALTRIISIAFASLALTVSQMAVALPGDHYFIDPNHLPKPFATRSVLRIPHIVPMPAAAQLQVPKGFHVSVYASGLHNPRWMTVLPNGDVVCVESRVEIGPNIFPKRIWLLRDSHGSGHADQRQLLTIDKDLPLGVAYHGGYLYVANTNAVVRWPYTVGQTAPLGKPETVIGGIPGHGYNQHWARNILFSPSGDRLYLTVGSNKNIAEEAVPRACVMAYSLGANGLPNGQPTVYANGLRNPVGLAFQPKTGALWTNCNERDYTGDELVPDFLTALKPGGFYGWPNYYIGAHHDPRMPVRPALARKVIVPDILLQSHSAPLGLCFYTAKQFPKRYWGDAFVALHGSTNRHLRTGYKIIRVRFNSHGKPIGGYEDFLTGWLPNPAEPTVGGRPAGITLDKTGALLIADDGGGKIWRVSYGPQH